MRGEYTAAQPQPNYGRGARFESWLPPPQPLVLHHGDVISVVAEVSPLIRHWLVLDFERYEAIDARLPTVSATSLRHLEGKLVRLEIAAGNMGNVIVERARSQMGKPYNLLFLNCEQFARWAATGKAQSVQLQRAVIGGGVAAYLAWLIFGDHGTYDANGRLHDKKGRFK